MYLFRRQGDTFDNYTFLVQPQIEQRSLNQQFNGDIRGPDNSSQQMQGVNPQQPYRKSENLQGVAAPYYMNTGNYFPQQQPEQEQQEEQ